MSFVIRKVTHPLLCDLRSWIHSFGQVAEMLRSASSGIVLLA